MAPHSYRTSVQLSKTSNATHSARHGITPLQSQTFSASTTDDKRRAAYTAHVTNNETVSCYCYEQHMYMYSSTLTNSRSYDCRYCGKLFKSSGNLNCHVRIHTGAKPYLCRHCSQVGQLKTHLLKSHNEGTWFTCRICQKKFTGSCDLKHHLHCHEVLKPYVCSECPKHFQTAGELKHHALRHFDVKLFCCGLCGKDYKHKQNVPRHLKRCTIKLAFSDV